MKQHITVKQLYELSDKGKEKLREWWKPTFGDIYTDSKLKEELVYGGLNGLAFIVAEEPFYPLLSIGQMVDILEVERMLHSFGYIYDEWISKEELCDELWSQVKEQLK